jgi:ribosomal protein S6--L-glutamate ligase
MASLHFIRHLELCGVLCCNSSHALERSRNKIRSFDELSRQRVPIPRTAFLSARVDLRLLLKNIPGPPWIAKLPESTQGKGVIFVESEQALRSLVDAVEVLSGRLMVQEYLADGAGSDIRVLVLGGKAIAAMRRRAPKGDFRSNLHVGGAAEGIALDEKLKHVAEQAAGALSLDMAGVDLMENSGGYAVIEVNGSPGLQGVQTVNKDDLAMNVLRLIEDKIGDVS